MQRCRVSVTLNQVFIPPVSDNTDCCAWSSPSLRSAVWPKVSHVQTCEVDLCRVGAGRLLPNRPTSCCKYGLNNEVRKWSGQSPRGIQVYTFPPHPGLSTKSRQKMSMAFLEEVV